VGEWTNADKVVVESCALESAEAGLLLRKDVQQVGSLIGQAKEGLEWMLKYCRYLSELQTIKGR
jgi:hypothetical protein